MMRPGHSANVGTRLCHVVFFFFTQVQTPVTVCSGELWSILVVRLAHSADLRSRLRHVSGAPSVTARVFRGEVSAPSVANHTGCFRVVTHPGTNPGRRCLSLVIGREPVCHRPLGVDWTNFYIKFQQTKPQITAHQKSTRSEMVKQENYILTIFSGLSC